MMKMEVVVVVVAKAQQSHQLLALISAPLATSNLHARRWPLEAAQMSAVFWLKKTLVNARRQLWGRKRWGGAGGEA